MFEKSDLFWMIKLVDGKYQKLFLECFYLLGFGFILIHSVLVEEEPMPIFDILRKKKIYNIFFLW